MLKRVLIILLVLAGIAVLSIPFLTRAQSGDLPRSTPAAEGISTAAVIDLMDSLLALQGGDIHHVMVVRHGKVVAEAHPAPFRASDSHTVFSVSKTFTSLAVGIAIDENRLRLDDRVMTFFHDKMPDVISDRMAALTVRDLLTMSSGVQPDVALRSENADWVKAWLAKPCDEEPGTRFRYDSMCTHVLAAILQRVTGRTLLDYLNEKLLSPMGIKRADWEMSPDSVNTGGWGLRVPAEALAKLGVLLLNKGSWQGKQLVSANYVDQACSRIIDCEVAPDTTTRFGYGYQLWQTTWPGYGDVSMASGSYGQYVVMLPKLDMVIVILGVINDNNALMGYIRDVLLAGVGDSPLASEKVLQQRLDSLCAHALIYLPQGKSTGQPVNGKRLVFRPNGYGMQWATVDNDTLKLARNGMPVESFPMGYREWRYGSLKGFPPYPIHAANRMRDLVHDFEAAAAWAWTTPSTLEVRVHYVNWITASTYVFDFDKHELKFRDDFPGTQPATISFDLK